jgi:prepilin-type N-terminal cleavage/methylation domain-containing protein
MKGMASAKNDELGFTLIELVISMVITLIILGVAVAVFSSALGSRAREASRTDAITSAQAALNIMSREIGNTGYGLTTNGIVLADSGANRLHFRTNTDNTDLVTTDPGEDVTFYCDSCGQCIDGQAGSVLRYDSNTNVTSGIINRVSRVDFTYYNYTGTSAPVASTTAAANTGRVNIKLTICLPPARNQPVNQTVLVSADVTLRNSIFMRGQY